MMIAEELKELLSLYANWIVQATDAKRRQQANCFPIHQAFLLAQKYDAVV